MNTWILLVPMAAFALLALAGWLMAWSYLRHFQHVRDLYAAACEERRLLYSQNADLREEVQERRAEVKTLQLQLSSLNATKPVQPSIPIKRVRGKKDEVAE